MNTCVLLEDDDDHGRHAACRDLVLLLLNPRGVRRMEDSNLVLCCHAAAGRWAGSKPYPGRRAAATRLTTSDNAPQHRRWPPLSFGCCCRETGAEVLPSGAGVSGESSLGGAPEVQELTPVA